MALHTRNWFSPTSTQHAVAMLSEGHAMPLSKEVEMLVLRRLVETKNCPICLSGSGQMCQVYGGMSTLMRTHPQRLHISRAERSSLVSWAVRKSGRRDVDPPEEADSDVNAPSE